MKNTKAQMVYRYVTGHIKSMIRTYGTTDFAVSLNSEDWVVCTRTVNELEKINEREKARYALDLKIGLDRSEVIEQTLKNIDLSIKVWRKEEAEWKKILNS